MPRKTGERRLDEALKALASALTAARSPWMVIGGIAVIARHPMSLWSDRLKNSVVFENLLALGPALDAAEARESVPQEDTEGLERIRTVLTVVGQRFESADGDLIRDATLDGLASLFAATTEQVRAYTTDGDAQHLVAAQAQVDSILLAIAAFVFPGTTKEFRGLRGAVEEYREAMTAQLKSFAVDAAEHTQAVNSLSGRLDEARAAFDTDRKALSESVQAFQTETAKAQATLAEAYASAGRKLDEDVRATVAEIKSTFDTAEAERKKEHAEATGQQGKTFTELVAKYDAALNDTQSGVKERMQLELESHADAHQKLQIEYEQKAEATSDDRGQPRASPGARWRNRRPRRDVGS